MVSGKALVYLQSWEEAVDLFEVVALVYTHAIAEMCIFSEEIRKGMGVLEQMFDRWLEKEMLHCGDACEWCWETARGNRSEVGQGSSPQSYLGSFQPWNNVPRSIDVQNGLSSAYSNVPVGAPVRFIYCRILSILGLVLLPLLSSQTQHDLPFCI